MLPSFFGMLIDQVQEQIRQKISETNPDVFVVDIQLKQGKQSVLSIKVDTDQGITLNACAEISRALGLLLEEEPTLDFPYKLEVSSPGVGQPLRLHRQYQQNLGRKLHVVFHDRQELKGLLHHVDEEFFVLEPLPTRRSARGSGPQRKTASEPVKVAFSDVLEAKVFI
ncbi:MAG: hypothetical protein D6722_23840 [Bacteroidetes bacterium]|nr:MAG: hypothetical protein D6722_23840 [Bacteroidota bacterium]